ncbi:MAG: hypothetical protein CVV29_00335 [Methanobacteriales archaeon HGW-Methanobacteriales-2]|nr:MAG: hypothetical protein CVV29_00335 [Methanobacteriales archaeon HGW-Methanobacteriales-2]
MKILHIIDHFVPQMGYQETHLARVQSNKGHEVRVLTSNILIDATNMYSAENFNKNTQDGLSIEEGIEVMRLPVLFNFPFFNKPWITKLEENIIDFKPDAIHLHGILSFTCIRVTNIKKELPNTRFVFDDHMLFIAMRNNLVIPFYKFFKVFFSKKIRDNSDAIVAISEETVEFMEKMYGIPSDEIIMIPLGCDTKTFHNDPKERIEIRENLGIEENDLVFCYAGKLIEEKGVDLLINAALKLLYNGKKLKVLIVGPKDKKYFDSINNIISSSPFEDSFIFIPAVPNNILFKYYSAADVCIWPKSCSISILEAMSCENPVILSNNSGVSNLILNGVNGFVYPEGDLESLFKTMERFFEQKLRKQMASNSRCLLKNFDWDDISDRFEKLYGETNY